MEDFLGGTATLPPWIVLDPIFKGWLLEDIGRGDRATQALFDRATSRSQAIWRAKEAGVVAGLPVAARIFELLDGKSYFLPLVAEGEPCQMGDTIARIEAPFDILLMGERVALNIAMRLSGIATATRQYTEQIADLPAQFVDTRKTTPGLRLLEKYASRVGGALNHRMGLDDAAMLKDNHIQAAGSIKAAIARVRQNLPYPLAIEVETSTLAEVRAAVEGGAEIVMLDNMSLEQTMEAVRVTRSLAPHVTIEASGNITLDNLRAVAETGVDYISSSAPITRSTWLDLSMKIAET
ncbi:MAG: carboxylating nicotinate-nucleotide diphosphorylase [Cyanobacteriota bacterium]|nr:carboxylating nicotinate-nucleotide diphosphorylase [Cyanobacteriota bacterium]